MCFFSQNVFTSHRSQALVNSCGKVGLSNPSFPEIHYQAIPLVVTNSHVVQMNIFLLQKTFGHNVPRFHYDDRKTLVKLWCQRGLQHHRYGSNHQRLPSSMAVQSVAWWRQSEFVFGQKGPVTLWRNRTVIHAGKISLHCGKCSHSFPSVLLETWILCGQHAELDKKQFRLLLVDVAELVVCGLNVRHDAAIHGQLKAQLNGHV